MAGVFPESDGRVVNVGVEQLLLFTFRPPMPSEYDEFRARVERALEVAPTLVSHVDLEQALDELGSSPNLRDVFGTHDRPGGLRASVTSPQVFAHILRTIIAFLERAHGAHLEAPATLSSASAPDQRTRDEAAPPAPQGCAPLRVTNEDEAYARSLMQEDDRLSHIPERLRR